MSRTIRVDDEVFKKIQDNARPFEPVWRAVRRTLGLDVPPDSVSMADYEESLQQEKEVNQT